MAIDPVCGTEVEVDQIEAVHDGKTYKFCCNDCKDEFLKTPEDYVNG